LLVTGDAAGGVILWNTISNTVYKRTTIPTHVQMLLYDHRYSYVKQQYKSARTRRRNSLTAEAHLLGGSRGEREKAGVSAVVFLDGLLIVGSADGNVYFMNPAGCHWTNSIVNITSTSAYPNEKRSILAMQASYEILTGDECVVRLAIVFSYGEPGEETTCLRFLRVINPLSAGHMELSTLRSVTTAQSIVAMQLIPDAVLTPCFGRDQNSAASRFLLLTADKSGEVRVMDEKGHHKGTVSDKLAVRPVLWWMDPSPDHRPDLRLGSVTNIVEQGKPAALVSPSPRKTYRAELTTQSTPVNVPAGGKNPAIASGVADLPVPKRGKPHEKPKHPAQSNSKTSRTMRTLQKHQLAKVPIPMKGMGDMHLRATKFMKRHRQELQQTQQSDRKLSLFDKLNETERLVMQRNRALLP
jgi:hypothetical protein